MASTITHVKLVTTWRKSTCAYLTKANCKCANACNERAKQDGINGTDFQRRLLRRFFDRPSPISNLYLVFPPILHRMSHVACRMSHVASVISPSPTVYKPLSMKKHLYIQ
eukprot:TRINITY_DN3501_c0_g1_i1.p1 TRINITY_DN3501_c0_g1~~TRINITY_DN3501_c0_g1_i1.p1  ORF type:complete len:110 (-),score=1.18 TRINITY_DN3501_c0_g1_i1:53-382(-)